MNAYEIRSNQVIEYMKLHLISLEQDCEKLLNQLEAIDGYDEILEVQHVSKTGQAIATRHLLSVAEGIMNP